MHSADAANSFMEDSLTYAMSYASGGLREAVRKVEKLQSVIHHLYSIQKTNFSSKQARFLCNIGAEANKSGISRILFEEIERQMFGIMGYILRRVYLLIFFKTNMNKEILSFCVHGNQSTHEKVHKGLEGFLNDLSTKKKHSIFFSLRIISTQSI